MPLLIDITQDRLYKQGKIDAITEVQTEAIEKLLKQKKLSLQEIADVFSVSVDDVKDIQANLKKQ